MPDRELKILLLETCPVRPGQEERAWSALKARFSANPVPAAWYWLFYPTWRGLTVAVLAIVFIPVMADYAGFSLRPESLATADSQLPGVYATSFYSRSAQAQVVWLNGMEPATDKPTYLDPTSVVSAPKGDPNSF
jgi:hypothetical protein